MTTSDNKKHWFFVLHGLYLSCSVTLKVTNECIFCIVSSTFRIKKDYGKLSIRIHKLSSQVLADPNSVTFFVLYAQNTILVSRKYLILKAVLTISYLESDGYYEALRSRTSSCPDFFSIKGT